MITGINESKTLTKHISWECKCKFDGRNCNSDQWWNNDKFRCECKNIMYVKKIMFGILLHVIVKMENIQQELWVIQRLCVILQSYTRKKQILMKKKLPVKHKISMFCLLFIKSYSIIDCCQYLLLSNKISSKTKTFIAIS